MNGFEPTLLFLKRLEHLIPDDFINLVMVIRAKRVFQEKLGLSRGFLARRCSMSWVRFPLC